jgi:hypothetical protein
MTLTFPPVQDSTLHRGTYQGRAKPHHGQSRAQQGLIIDTTGSEVWTLESIDAEAGTIVKYRLGFPDSTRD